MADAQPQALSSRDTVYVIPASFGFGPASLAVAACQAFRAMMPALRVVGAADGFAREFLAAHSGLDAVEECAPGQLPGGLTRLADRSVAVFFGDFERPAAAVATGIPTGVIDALYWMWDRDPMDPRAADFYLALAFPGVEERRREQGSAGAAVDVIPQVVYRPAERPRPAVERSGVLVNLGGAMSPLGGNHEYLRALLEVIAGAVGRDTDSLVACSAAAAAEISAPGAAPLPLRPLATSQMLHELGTRALLLTVPGQSIIWEALQAGIPMVVLPGANYSQHRQTGAYRRFISGAQFVTWDDVKGYDELPAKLPESEGVTRAVELGLRLAGDPLARKQLGELISESLSRAHPPRLRPGSPWSRFDGADHVARRVLSLMNHGR